MGSEARVTRSTPPRRNRPTAPSSCSPAPAEAHGRSAGATSEPIGPAARADPGDGAVRLLGPAAIRDLAVRHGVAPSKGRGQNFVLDPNTVRRIAALAGVRPGDAVLEVGPGLGSLTLALVEAGATVTAVEVDPVLAAALPETIAAQAPGRTADVRVVLADAVAVAESVLLPDRPSSLVANLPYNVAVPVLLGVLERLPSVRTGLVMVQAEVGHRLAAAPGSRVYGAPSAKAAWWAEVRVAGRVSRSVFWPQPRVDSVLVAFSRRPAPGPDALRPSTFRLVDAAFAQRRKTLRSALAAVYGSAPAAAAALESAGLDPGARGETLGIADFARLAAAAAAVPP